MTDAAVLRELAELRSKVDTLTRQAAPSRGLGIGVSTNQSGLNFRTTQLGFAGEITQSYSETTGYSWKQLGVRKNPNLESYDPPIQLTGEDAFPIDGNEDYQTGDTIWIEPDVEASYYWCWKSGQGNEPPPPAPCGGCAWFAGASQYDCWTLTVVGAGGNMASVDDEQELSLTWVEDAAYYDGGYWESDDDFTVCDYVGLVQLYRDDRGNPQLYLVDPDVVMSLSCCDTASQTLYFSLGNAGARVLCCVQQTNEGPAFNIFTLAIAWTLCPLVPNPDYTTPGWYCIAAFACDQARSCCYLTTDPGIDVLLCSGPHADEATCTPLCAEDSGPPYGPPVDFCGDGVLWPLTIFAYFFGCTGTAAHLNGQTIPLVFEAVLPDSWGASGSVGGGSYGLNLENDCPTDLVLNNSGTCNFSISVGSPTTQVPFLASGSGLALDFTSLVNFTLTE